VTAAEAAHDHLRRKFGMRLNERRRGSGEKKVKRGGRTGKKRRTGKGESGEPCEKKF